jgi:peptidoglycan/xylan/chitin deacetylase (PgdA/CDA1 family)
MSATARNLCLHYLHADAKAERASRRLSVSVSTLRARLLAELERGEPASLLDYLGTPPPADRFTVSFDDAHRSVLELAAPLLAELKIPGTLFVPTAWTGMGPEWLDADGLRALRDLGWSIGAHSVHHPRMSWSLYDEDAARHAARLRDECAQSRDVLTRILGAPPQLFAYPYGEDPPAARAAARDAGFSASFTVREDLAWDGDVHAIPRLDGLEATGLVRAGEGEPIGISVVIPARDRSAILRETLTRLQEQSYPEDLHEVIVVDDGSSEDLRAVLPDDPRFRLLPSTNESGRFQAGQTRTRGAAAARHPIVAFLDGDVAVGRDYLWALDWVHRRWSDTVLCGYLSGYNLHDLGHLHTLDQIRGVTPIESIPVIPDRQREPPMRAVLDNIDWLEEPWRLCYTGNLSLPRALFDRIGGFDGAFSGWGLEDLDLGVRLHQAGARWVFSRFALGYHVVDPSEPTARNPFRREHPSRDDFAGFLANLETLRARHPSSDVIARYAARTEEDIDETCSRPDTVGIEFGGAASHWPPFHARLHRLQPGGVTTEELLDRVAYAVKVGAKRLWLLGGEPAEHPGFRAVLDEAHRRGLRLGLETMGHPFADAELARQAHRAGLRHATLLTFGGDEASHDALVGEGSWARHLEGARNLETAGVHLSAHLVLTPSTASTMAAHEATLRALERPIDQRTELP